MLTPRQKAIIVGGLLGKSIYINDRGSISYSGTSRLHYWIAKELESIDKTSPKVIDFFKKCSTNIQSEKWIMKMSPLAVAVFVMSRKHKGVLGQLCCWAMPYDTIILIQKMFQQNWGINLKYTPVPTMLTTASTNDSINLWILIKQFFSLALPEETPILDIHHLRTGKKIYLSGGQQMCENGGINWRAQVSPILFKLGYDIVNPAYDQGWMDEFGVNLQQLKNNDFATYMRVGQAMIKEDRRHVLASDGMLVYWNRAAELGSGTKSEITWSNDFNMPCVLVLAPEYSKKDLPIWTLGGIRNEQHIVRSLEDGARVLHEAINRN